MGLELEPKNGDTFLSPEEIDQLIPRHITNRKQLDELEQDNIEDAYQWLLSKRFKKAEEILSCGFLDTLHKRMLGKVWKWAGKRRAVETNIGVAPHQIEVSRQQLIDDALFWIDEAKEDPIMIALRIHHRLVHIHCYPNGSGRHSRIVADLILTRIYGLPEITWIGEDFGNPNRFRDQYIAALRQADHGNYEQLLNCVVR